MKGRQEYRPLTTMHGNTRRRRIKIATPTIDTYSKQIRQCQRQYTNLHLDEPPYTVPSSPFQNYRWRENTFSSPSRSNVIKTNTDDLSPSADFPDLDLVADDNPRTSLKMDPSKLISFLQMRGLGEVKLLRGSSSPYCSQVRPKVKTRAPSRDPYQREKLKGQARLDYELANVRAEAFCAQQRGMFRTASAGFRDRDQIFVEEEIRGQMHRDINVSNGTSNGESSRDEEREELFERIQLWMDDVESALDI